MVLQLRCFITIVLASWYQSTLGVASVTPGSHCDSSKQEGSACRVEEREEDEGSLLQLKVSMQKEHQTQDVSRRHDVVTNRTNSSSGLALKQSGVPEMQKGAVPASLALFAQVRDLKRAFHGSFGQDTLVIVIPIFLLGIAFWLCSMGRGKDASRSQGSPRLPMRSQRNSSDPLLDTSSGRRSSPRMGPPGGITLCPSLVVPEEKQFRCVVPRLLCRERQSLSFDVRSLPERGAEIMLKVVVAEMNEFASSGIYLKSGDGADTLAYLSTDDLWTSPRSDHFYPALSLFRPAHSIYGTIQKFKGNEGVIVMRGQTLLLTLSGDNTNLRASSSDGRTVGEVTEFNPEEYLVTVGPNADPGLVILTLLAAAKLDTRRS